MSNIVYLTEINQVIVFDSENKAETWIHQLKSGAKHSNVSLLCISCRVCGGSSVPPVCVVDQFFSQISERLKIPWWHNPLLWLWLRQWRKPVSASIADSVKAIDTISALEGLLAYHNEDIRIQIKNITKAEKSKYVIFLFEHFEEINQQNQPATAGLIHRLLKNAPAYFKIISVGDPLLFRKDSLGEIGIQRDHDYKEVRQVN